MKNYKYDFTADLITKLVSSLKNNFGDENIDKYRLSPLEVENGKKYKPKELLFSFAPGFFKKVFLKLYLKYSSYGPRLARLNRLYNTLSDEHSRMVLMEIIAFSILNFKYVKLSVNTPEYWRSLDLIEKEADKKTILKSNFRDMPFLLYDLSFINYDIKLHSTAMAILVNFVNEQYAYKKNNTVIKVDPGDVVIEGGGCWGDTALYFATLAGESGRVYSFEFVGSNIDFFQKNLSLNPKHKDQVEIVRHPLFDKKGIKMKFSDGGPGSRIFSTEGQEEAVFVETQTIDDFVNEKNINKVDFIKLDIEGSEMKTLQGAVNTMRKFRPKLAIAVYHDIKDLYEIQEFIEKLDLGYKFYLDHFTIHWEETILFAVSEK